MLENQIEDWRGNLRKESSATMNGIMRKKMRKKSVKNSCPVFVVFSSKLNSGND